MVKESHDQRIVVSTVDYRRGGIRIVDQTLLPAEEVVLDLRSAAEVAEALTMLRVRGAPAIGVVAAYGVLISLENLLREKVEDPPPYFFDRLEGVSGFEAGGLDPEEFRARLLDTAGRLASTRPTAVNLFWALDRMKSAAEAFDPADTVGFCGRVAREAFEIHESELEIEFAIGRNGSRYIKDGMAVLTHCNAGGLATAGYGTALGVIYRALEEGKNVEVYADETRPLLQGARLTAWELRRRGVEVTVLCEGAAASLISSRGVDAVLVGADRIAGNGDTANKVGTLGLAVLCERYGVPFFVAAPWSTFDVSIGSGEDIPIENRPEEEVTCFAGRRTAPAGVSAYNPAFDVTPAELITAIITERGVIEEPDGDKIAEIARASGGAQAGR